MNNFWVCLECAVDHQIEIPEGQATTSKNDRSWCAIGQHQTYERLYYVIGDENDEV